MNHHRTPPPGPRSTQPSGRPTPAPDWRSRLGPGGPAARPVRKSVRPRRAARTAAVSGEVLSESEAHWSTRATGTGVLTASCLLLAVGQAVRTGLFAVLLREMVTDVSPLVVVLVLGTLALALLPVSLRRLLWLFVLPLSVLLRNRPSRPTLAATVGRQLVVRTTSGLEEVLVAAPHRVPPGTWVTAWGPAWFGRRHAWVLVRRGLPGLVVCRGVGRCLGAVLVLVLVLVAGWIAAAGR